MRLIKNILGRLWAIWALVSFITTFIIIYPPSMVTWLIPGYKGQDIFIKIARLWIRVWLTLIGCRFVIKGKENFKKGESYIITCNHNSFLDPPLSSPFIQGPNKTIAKSDFEKIPLFKYYYRKGGILINRKSEESRRKGYEAMKQVLAQRIHMCIYPEGTRNRSDEPLKKFHNGAFRLAVETGHAIMPAVILNTKKVLPPNKTLWGWPGKIEIHFLEPVVPEQMDIEQLKEKIFAIMQNYYLQKEGQ
jgi:1-acyl-sn-glycerol-3-phosphate acyltransferase